LVKALSDEFRSDPFSGQIVLASYKGKGKVIPVI